MHSYELARSRGGLSLGLLAPPRAPVCAARPFAPPRLAPFFCRAAFLLLVHFPRVY